MGKKNWNKKGQKYQQEHLIGPAAQELPVTSILRQIGARYGEGVPSRVQDLLLLIQQRAPVVGAQNPVVVFTTFLDEVIADKPAEQQSTLLAIRNAIAQTSQHDMEAVVDRLDAIRGVKQGRAEWEGALAAAKAFYQQYGVSLTVRNFL